MDDTSLLTSDEVAKLLRVHPKHIYRLLRRGLPGRRAGGKWLFARPEVDAWLARGGAASVTAPPSDPSKEDAAPAPPARDVSTSAQAPDLEPTRLERSPLPESPPPLLAANGDVAIELLLSTLRDVGKPLLGMVQTDKGRGFELLRQGRVLASGWHGDAAPQEVGGQRYVRLLLVQREVGLVSPPGRDTPHLEALRLCRLASRPRTAGVRRMLDDALLQEGLDPEAIHAQAQLLESHLEVVCAVARGDAQAGLTSRAWASRLGLPFRPLGWETYSLVFPVVSLSASPLVRICEQAQSAGFRTLLEGIPGYDVGVTGAIRFDSE